MQSSSSVSRMADDAKYDAEDSSIVTAKRIPPSLKPIKLERGKTPESRKFTDRESQYAERTVEMQTTLAHKNDSIWNCVLRNDIDGMRRMVQENPEVLLRRGAVGEIPLHLTFIYQHLDMTKAMLGFRPDLITAVYEGAQYQGENCLHIAIVNQNFEMVRFLVESAPSLLEGRAVGRFFSIGQACYFGELPVHFAACTGNVEILQYLLSKGGRLDQHDSNGNNLLHLMVIHRLEKMHDFIEDSFRAEYEDMIPDEVRLLRRQDTGRHYSSALGKELNKMGETPFTLCARLGFASMFSHLIKRRQEIQWTYGPVTNILHPLEDLDVPLNVAERRGAIQLMVDEGHQDLLFHPEIRGILRKKWRTFARKLFMNNFLVSCAFVALITFTLVLNPSDDASTWGYVNLICELVILVLSVMKFLSKIRLLFHTGIRAYFNFSGAAYFDNLMSIVGGVLVVAVAIAKVVDRHGDVVFLLEAAVGACAWMYMAVFLMGFRFTGPFVVMMYRMVRGDLTRWLFLYPIILMSFALSNYILQDENSLDGILDILKLSFSALHGEFKFDEFTDNSKFPVVSAISLVLYVLLATIMLLTLLIAMMSNTFERIRANAEKEWHLEWARIVIALEVALSEDERKKHPYWTEFKGMRFVQVEEVNVNFFKKIKDKEPQDVKSAEEMDIEDDDDIPEHMERLASLVEESINSRY